MKTRIASTFLLFIFLMSTTAFAVIPEPVPASKAVSRSVAKFIQKELQYPEYAIADKFEGTVVVDLVIQDDGTFDVQAANCVDDEMRKHVVASIEKLESTEYNAYAGQRVLIKVSFDLLLY